MPTISVITAVDPNRSQHLSEAWDSLKDQQLPEGWSFEWLLQCDSDDQADQKTVLSHLPELDDRVSFGAFRSGGPAIARTMALSRAKGMLVKNLDADDMLTPGVLARDIDACRKSGVVYSASRVMNVNPDGTETDHYPKNPEPGRIRAGSALLAYKKENWRILVHPATLCIRYDNLAAAGGWMAMTASEDTGLLMFLDVANDGWFHDEVGLRYRRWSPQMSQEPQHSDPVELEARHRLIVERAEAHYELTVGGI